MDAETNTPPKSNLYKRFSIIYSSSTLNGSLWKRSAQAHKVTGLGATTAYQPPLSPYRVGDGLHSISGRFKVGVWLKPTKPRGLVVGSKGVSTRDARGRFYNWTGWDHGGGHVGLWSSLGPIPNYVILVLGNDGGALIICKLEVLTLNIHQYSIEVKNTFLLHYTYVLPKG